MSNPRILLIFLVLISCFVIWFKTTTSTSSASNSDEIKQTGISSTKDVEQITKKSITEIGEENLNQQRGLPNIIFSCFYFRPDFYSGRKVPSLDWIIVMVESAFEHRLTIEHSITSSSNKRDTKLVMFVDANTKERLEKLITEREKAKKRENFIENKFLELVLIDEENDVEVKALFSQNRWADSTKLKNAANNFRFWFIQRYLKNLLLEQNHRLSQLSSMKIAIVDATDVLFQKNPFIDDGTCFPRHHQRPPSFAPSYFLFTLEDASKNFNNEIYNKRWMKCYDANPQEKSSSSSLLLSPLAEMGKIRMRISCAGVSLGSFYGVLTYLQAQLGEISKPSLTECAITGVKAALDQATHNYLMYAGVFASSNRKSDDDTWRTAFGEVINKTKETEKQELFVAALPHHHARRNIQKFGKGTIWNSFVSDDHDRKQEITSSSILKWNDKSDCVFHGNFGKLSMDGDKVVIGGSKFEYAIVHQYTSDRHPKVMKVARTKYDV